MNRPVVLVRLVALLAFVVRVAVAGAASGDLDPGYGSGGLVRVESGSWGQRLYTWGVAGSTDPGNPDGVVLIGVAVANDALSASPASAGVSSTGVLLGVNALTLPPEAAYFVRLAADQTDAGHRFYAVGSVGVGAPENRAFLVARLSPLGDALDPTWGGGAPVTTQIPGTTRSHATTVAVQGDGKLLVGGGADDDYAAMVLARYDTDGNLDPDFGTAGTLVMPDAGLVTALAEQPDGRILVGGYLRQGAIANFGIMRLLADGTVDPTFGTDGIAITGFSARYAEATPAGMSVLADGRIVAAGSEWSQYADRGAFVAARFDASGALDPTFGKRGRYRKRVGRSNIAGGVAFHSDGKTLIAGSGTSTRTTYHTQIALLRLTTAGKPDRTFGRGGKVRTTVTEAGEGLRVQGVVLDGAGGATVVGVTADGTGKATVLARYLP